MEKTNEIFSVGGLEVFWMDYAAKGIGASCSAVNPQDGKTYTKFAGWISKTLALHGGAATPGYIYENACRLIHENASEILEAVILFLGRQQLVELMPNGDARATLLCEQLLRWTNANADKAGRGIENKHAHPLNESQRQEVREMQKG